MAELKITKQMEKTITDKENLIKQLDKKTEELLNKELHEKQERVKIFVKMEKESEGKKITDKSKNAEADHQLKDTITEIQRLSYEIDKIKRHITLCNDKLSLYRNMIRELQL